MIHLISFNYASPALRELFMSERTMKDDEKMLELFNGIPGQYTFVDKYGPESVFAQIGLSWWRDVVPRLNEDFVLSTAECRAVSEMILSAMPPAPSKVIQALGDGTELSHCVEQYPDANVIRDPSVPYSPDESSALYFRLGQLTGLLISGHHNNGILVSP
jgi:hypothetical protein